MPDPINLRQVRKAFKRRDQEAVAAQNRIAFGKPKSVTALSKAQNDLDRRRLDGHALNKDETT